jgi:hypothetical protein
MRFFITYDADIPAGLDDVLNPLVDLGFKKYFAEKYYEDSGIEMAVVLMCRDPRWNFKQRIRFVKKDNCLYMDIMLDYEHMTTTDTAGRKRYVAEKLVNEVPQIIAKYKFRDFDLKRFSSDLSHWFKDRGWIDRELESWPTDLM